MVLIVRLIVAICLAFWAMQPQFACCLNGTVFASEPADTTSSMADCHNPAMMAGMHHASPDTSRSAQDPSQDAPQDPTLPMCPKCLGARLADGDDIEEIINQSGVDTGNCDTCTGAADLALSATASLEALVEPAAPSEKLPRRRSFQELHFDESRAPRGPPAILV